MHRRTKIICTFGPATDSWDAIQSMYEAGMNVLRINMSHASFEEAERAIRWIRTLNRQVKYTVPILLDTSGPEVRTDQRPSDLDLRLGSRVRISASRSSELDETNVPFIQVDYPDFNASVGVGETILLDNGLINLKVLSSDEQGLLCRVTAAGELGSKKHVNMPGVRLNLPSITEKDRETVRFGLSHAVSYIAQSFVRSAADVQEMRDLIGDQHRWVKIIAKIENQEGVELFDEIASEAHAIMVARGDLGIETDMSELPALQRQLVEKTIQAGKRCIVATHMLESMVDNPIPTRAEVNDVANAVDQDVDAIMLSAETSVGQHPIRATDFVRRVAEAQEKLGSRQVHQPIEVGSNRQHLARAAVELAERIQAAGIVVITRSGWTADIITNCAPRTVPIFAFSNESHTRRRLALNRGVYAFRTDFSSQPEKTILRCMNVLSQRETLPPEASVVVVSDAVGLDGQASIQIRRPPSQPKPD